MNCLIPLTGEHEARDAIHESLASLVLAFVRKGGSIYVFQKVKRGGRTQEFAGFTKAQGEAPHDPDDGDDAHGDVVLHDDGQDVLLAHETAVEESQAGSHQVDQGHGHDDEARVSGVNRRHFFIFFSPCCVVVVAAFEEGEKEGRARFSFTHG